jgi:hypothetical protein
VFNFFPPSSLRLGEFAMPRLLLAIAIPILLCLLLSSCQRQPTAGVEEGFKPIFNGKDLTGWEGKPGWWRVEDGAITAEVTAAKPLNDCNYLFWRGGKPADFELRASFKLTGPEANSGIQFRTQELPGGDAKGYQADMDTKARYTGILYDCNQRGIMNKRGEKVVISADGKREVTTFADAAKLQKLFGPNDWNDYVIIARGPEIILAINGVMTTHVIDREKGKAAAKGLIALQLHGGHPMKVQFKNLRIKEEHGQ